LCGDTTSTVLSYTSTVLELCNSVKRSHPRKRESGSFANQRQLTVTFTYVKRVLFFFWCPGRSAASAVATQQLHFSRFLRRCLSFILSFFFFFPSLSFFCWRGGRAGAPNLTSIVLDRPSVRGKPLAHVAGLRMRTHIQSSLRQIVRLRLQIIHVNHPHRVLRMRSGTKPVLRLRWRAEPLLRH